MIVSLLAYFFGINIRKELVGKRSFRVCEVLRRGCGKSIEMCISSLVSSIEALLEWSAGGLQKDGEAGLTLDLFGMKSTEEAID